MNIYILTQPFEQDFSDINSIENLWAEIGKKFKNYKITSKDVLKQKIVEVCNSIESTIEKLHVTSSQSHNKLIVFEYFYDPVSIHLRKKCFITSINRAFQYFHKFCRDKIFIWEYEELDFINIKTNIALEI
ncbi:LOW QUALITY PROTEIN: dynein axonemal heavy chain 7-like [Vespula maculifrons]|uniref:Dynein axonemal heavy chain 7-like n=1 Tax=Vespula maculifrons TaxID=7453 RepID=A0ABD2CW01_VESMC